MLEIEIHTLIFNYFYFSYFTFMLADMCCQQRHVSSFLKANAELEMLNVCTFVVA